MRNIVKPRHSKKTTIPVERWDVPKSWKWVFAGEIAQIVGGGTPKRSKDEENYDASGIPWITPSDLSGYQEVYISRGTRSLSEQGFANSSARLMPSGTVLFTSRAPVGYCVIAKNKVTTNQGFRSFVLMDGLCAEYLRYYLLFSRDYIRDLASGTTFKELSGAAAAKISIPLPPTNEQKRIATRIKNLLNKIDHAEGNIRHVRELLSNYRQSVLNAAVRGELTCGWRKLNNHKLESGEQLLERILKSRNSGEKQFKQLILPFKRKCAQPRNKDVHDRDKENGYSTPATEVCPEIPDNWCNVRMDVAGDVHLGRQRSPKHHRGTHMRPYLRVANVFEDRIDVSDVKEMNFTPKEFDLYELRPNDILLNEGQSLELVGRPAIYRGEIVGACFTNTLIRFKACDAVLPEYALIVFRHYLWSGRFRRIAKITTNIAHLGLGRFAELGFPIPPLSEQEVIVDEARRQLVAADHCDLEISRLVRIAAATRRSILKAAFSGQLVQQDPNDEPAAKLLEHIKGKNGGTSKWEEIRKKRRKNTGRKLLNQVKKKRSA